MSPTTSTPTSTSPPESVKPAGRETDGLTTGRVEGFSDGVLAIAITLLVLQLGSGHVGSSLADRLSHQWPLFLSYLISFMNIGTVWLNHHRVVGRLGRIDHTFLVLNLLLLMVVAFLPFPTRVVGEELAGGTDVDQRTAALLYGATFLVASIAFFALWLWAAKERRLIKPGASDQLNRVRTLRFAVAIPLFAIPCALALVNPVAALAADGVIMASFLFSDTTTEALMLRIARSSG
jgi:TMEM175 potassium channel family protein